MYEIYLNEELKVGEYNKIIEFAFSNSDAFMLITNKISKDSLSKHSLPNKKIFKKNQNYLQYLEGLEKMKKEAIKKIDISNEHTNLFLDKLNPYLIKKRFSTNDRPGISVISNTPVITEIFVYKTSEEVKRFILESKGLFNWRYPYLPEDLSFFKNGYCWFYSVAHEEYAYIYTSFEGNIEKLKNMGIKFKVKEKSNNDIKLYYEKYEL